MLSDLFRNNCIGKSDSVIAMDLSSKKMVSAMGTAGLERVCPKRLSVERDAVMNLF
jgi:hypothetical protein